MAAAVLRLLTLIALMLMPLGMAAAPAVAQPVPAEHAMAAMEGHCDEMPGEEQAPPMSKMDCMAMCTALPPAFAAAPEPVMKPRAPRSIALSAPFDGIVPEIATPPPRRG